MMLKLSPPRPTLGFRSRHAGVPVAWLHFSTIQFRDGEAPNRLARSKAPRDYNAATCSERRERERGKIDAVSLVPSFRSGRIDCGYRELDGRGLNPETVLMRQIPSKKIFTFQLACCSTSSSHPVHPDSEVRRPSGACHQYVIK